MSIQVKHHLIANKKLLILSIINNTKKIFINLDFLAPENFKEIFLELNFVDKLKSIQAIML